ncbi:MBL fold metallo-hydrolase [Pseudodesulfovibrio cashew]|uniref:MBL fold metallo-hydrolase n=1 Tax=Pseudodesulfovibrio cashew TaxID=2678688 RepID=A0A6I6JJI9_9BACT|nr:MBL fold metallo-hydrolase [Pseudodesulfovibrio cashew]QGY40472.1 MBL fold metallo-hydrolase [Pseudodesulfovibrio cashew]
MRIVLTYIHHNCFVMKTPGRCYLFDYPNDSHLPPEAGELVARAVAGTDLTIFISHGHEDHLNSDIVSVAREASCVRYVLSDDMEEMRPEVIPPGREVLIVEPDETYRFGGLEIRTLLSNDLGVAFLVSDGKLRFYYGGDLAKWIWKAASEQERKFTSEFFRRAMERVASFSPHVAFSNVDRRLENLAGGLEAYSTAGARVFVPMHTFGDTAWLAGFKDLPGADGGDVFVYRHPGDSAEFII